MQINSYIYTNQNTYMKKLLSILLVSATLIACTNKEENKKEASTFDLEKVKAEIVASNKAYCEGFAKGDSAAVVSKYTKDGCVMPANAPKLCGAQGVGAFVKGGMAMGITNMNLTTDEVMGGPEAVVEVGTYELFAAGNKSIDKGKFVVAWKQEDGKWKMHRDCFTTNAPLPSAKK